MKINFKGYTWFFLHSVTLNGGYLQCHLPTTGTSVMHTALTSLVHWVYRKTSFLAPCKAQALQHLEWWEKITGQACGNMSYHCLCLQHVLCFDIYPAKGSKQALVLYTQCKLQAHRIICWDFRVGARARYLRTSSAWSCWGCSKMMSKFPFFYSFTLDLKDQVFASVKIQNKSWLWICNI